MKYLKTYEGFNMDKIKGMKLKDLIGRGRSFSKKVWAAVKNEGKETKMAIKILQRMLKGKPVSANEKKFLKEQSKDVARILPLIAIQGIPVPIPITPFLIILGKKYGFNFLPGDQKELKKEIEKEKKKLESFGFDTNFIDFIEKGYDSSSN